MSELATQEATYTLPSGRVLHVDPFQNREEWLIARRDHVGASEVAAILNLSPYSSPLEVYARKIGALNENIENDAMTWGLMQEDPIARWATERLGYTVMPSPGAVESTLCKRLSCTPDRIAYDDGGELCVLEFKHSALHWEDDEPPAHHLIQIQVNMDVTGIHKGVLIGALAGRPPIHRVVEYNERLAEMYRARVAHFWTAHVEKMIPPTPDGSAAAVRALNALYPRDTGATIEFSREMLPLHLRREAIKEQMDALESELDTINNRFRAAIADASKGIYIGTGVEGDPSFGYSCKVVERPAHTVKASASRQLRKVKV